MSFSASGGHGIKAEPNLTPLLDLVLQLLMFFMITINFVTEQVSGEIQLPQSEAARLEKAEADVLFVQIDQDGKMVVPSQGGPLNENQMQVFLQTQYNDIQRLHGKVDTSIVIRADYRADYGNVFKVMQICKNVGFRHLRLRAITVSKPT
jgi:biopolymer transport protein ExbD